MSLVLLPTGPANHNTVIMSASWDQVCAYSEAGGPVPWLGSSPTAPFTRHQWTVGGSVPPEATHVLLRVKLKAYVPGGAGVGYCQANCRVPIDGQPMNHFIHAEEWGREAGNSGVGRRVTFATLFAPVIDGKVTIDVAHEIYGRGLVEFAAYLEGYVE